MLSLYNTLSRKKEDFIPLHDKKVGLYTCGPTVYNFAHIGNLRTYVFEDILRRVLKYNDYEVEHVMNITDVGHLTDDADQGEDKMEKGSKREGKTAWEIAEFYTEAFKQDLEDLNILEPNVWCKATDHIQEQINLVQTLIDKGLTYETSDGIYFDTTKIDDYGKLAQLDKQDLKAGARVDMGEKKNERDFALWKWSSRSELHPEDGRSSELHPKGGDRSADESPQRQMEWDAFGKKGFPGWHIECSAMSMKYLGEQFDIHCGGVDHIPVHHTNEIAQSESATGKKPWVKYWLHGEFLLTGDEEKMAKSGNNFTTLQTLKDRGLSPLAYRFFILQAHYRKQLSFSWEAFQAAEAGLKRLKEKVSRLKDDSDADPKIEREFLDAINDDLNTAEALAIIQDGLKRDRLNLETIIKFDKILGLDLHKLDKTEIDIPDEVQKLLDERKKAREEKNWEEADRLRDDITKLGFSVQDGPALGGEVEDTDEGQVVK